MNTMTMPEASEAMAYREKLAWAGLLSLVICYGAYFVLRPLDEPATTYALLRRLGAFAAATAGRGVLWGVAGLALRARTPASDRVPPDERDRAIARRGGAFAYGVMMAGMILVGIVMPFSNHGWQIVNAAFFAITVAEAARLSLILSCYRRGWHG